MEETLASLDAEAPKPAQIADLPDGMQTLVKMLVLETGVADEQAATA
jgi:hypothetical protein